MSAGERRKRLVIYSMYEHIANFLYSTIQQILGKEVDIEVVSSERRQEVRGIPDLVLISNDEVKEEAERSFPGVPIFLPNRVITGCNLEKLLMLPGNSDVLLVNHPWEAVNETIKSLVGFGINHINYVPFDLEIAKKGGYDSLEIAVSPGMTHLVPEGIKDVIDIGPRSISAHSFLDLLTELDLSTGHLDKFIFNYYSILMESYRKINSSLHQSEILRKNLEVIFDQYDDGIMSVDENGKISRANHAILGMLEMRKEEAIGRNMQQFLSAFCKIADLADDAKRDGGASGIYSYRNRKILVKNIPVCTDSDINHIFTFHEIEKIQKIEQNVRMKLRQEGHVAKYNTADLWSRSGTFQSLVDKALNFSKSEMSILITGESGTGKELFAHVIHNNSLRREGPFVAVNFAGLSENLIESELFGYEEGAFTGAKKGGKRGLFEHAHGGTIFLDEIGNAPLSVQSKLLRVLQEKEIMRVGGLKIIPVDVRVIAATNINLMDAIARCQFRKDLYYRLNTLPLELPPLRERKEDLVYLMNRYLNGKYKAARHIPQEVADCINAYDWPGNIRELINITEYIFHASAGEAAVGLEHLPEYIKNRGGAGLPESPPGADRNCDPFPGIPENDHLLELLVLLRDRKHRVSGKNSLLAEMNNRRFPITESRLRNSINYLKKLNLVRVGTTKQGTTITAEGERLIERVAGNRHPAGAAEAVASGEVI